MGPFSRLRVMKNKQDRYQQFDEFVIPITEKAICYALEEKGLHYPQDFIVHEKISNVAFNKGKKHDVDLVLKSHNGDKLYVEIKGQMTYLEVNKLRYLLGLRRHFYLLQLTEIDWMEPYDKSRHGSKFQKSKKDFEDQIEELVRFVNGEITGKVMAERSIQRLDDYIEYRNHDIERWSNV